MRGHRAERRSGRTADASWLRLDPLRIAILSSARWSSFPGSMHYTARALREFGHDVFWVDPPVSPGSVLRQPERRADLCGSRHETAPDGLAVWRPLAVPGQNGTLGQALNGHWVGHGVSRGLGRPGLSICFTPEARSVMRKLPGVRIYSCIDSLRDLPGVDPRLVERREQELIDAVDLVAACSLPLVDQLALAGKPVTYIPHGYDEGLAAEALGRSELPASLVGRPRPFIGYVGSINFRLDAELLRAALSGSGGGTLVLVGGHAAGAGPAADPAVRALLDRPDVVAVGHQEQAGMAAYLACLDLGLVPYRPGPFNRKSFPLKVPQYLSAGLPVVSTANGATDELIDQVSVAERPGAFEAATRAALATDDPARRVSRRQAARRRTWKVVAEELLRLAAETSPGS